MVNVNKGVLVECDPAMKQLLLHLDETLKLGRKFVIHDLDDTHLFLEPTIINELQAKIDEILNAMNVSMIENN